MVNQKDIWQINLICSTLTFFSPALPSCSSSCVCVVVFSLFPVILSASPVRNATHLRSAQCQMTSGLPNHTFIHSEVFINVPASFWLSGYVCYQHSVLDTRLTDRATHFSRAAATSCRPWGLVLFLSQITVLQSRTHNVHTYIVAVITKQDK